MLQKALPKQYAVDSLVMLEVIKTLSASILIKQLDKTKTYTLDSLLEKTSLAANLSATLLVRKLASKGVSVDTLLLKTVTEQLLTDLILKKVKSASYNVTMLLTLLGGLKSLNVDGYLEKLNIPIPLDLDLILVKRLLSTLNLDIILKGAVQKLLVADIILYQPTLIKEWLTDVIVSFHGAFGISSFKIGKRRMNFDIEASGEKD
jgi:hypothetical protein